MRKALCIGIDYYENFNSLPGCSGDAKAIGQLLETNLDGTENFDVTFRVEKNSASICTAAKLEQEIRNIFSQEVDTVLFYYSGHGGIIDGKGFLVPSDADYLEDMFPMERLLEIINQSNATNKIVILDCCHAGSLGKFNSIPGCDVLPENTTILAASRADQTSALTTYGSLFTMSLYQALHGGAANILGEITPASIYSFIDRALSNHDQRPVFKANLDNFICLRTIKPSIKLEDLKKIIDIFYMPEYDYPLNPSYEEDKRDVKIEKYKVHNPENEAIFAVLRKYAALNMVEPVDLPEDKNYMYWAAVLSKACRLTPHGRYYWTLVKEGII